MSNAFNDQIYDNMANILGDLTVEKCQKIDKLIKKGNLEDADALVRQWSYEIAKKELHG